MMEWGKFLMIVLGIYVIYYLVNIMLDLMKGSSSRLGNEEAPLIITGIDPDHQINELREDPEEVPSTPINTGGLKQSQKVIKPPIDPLEIKSAITPSVISKGLNLTELLVAFKQNSIELTKDIAFHHDT